MLGHACQVRTILAVCQLLLIEASYIDECDGYLLWGIHSFQEALVMANQRCDMMMKMYHSYKNQTVLYWRVSNSTPWAFFPSQFWCLGSTKKWVLVYLKWCAVTRLPPSVTLHYLPSVKWMADEKTPRKIKRYRHFWCWCPQCSVFAE